MGIYQNNFPECDITHFKIPPPPHVHFVTFMETPLPPNLVDIICGWLLSKNTSVTTN